MINQLSDAEYALGELESGYRSHYLAQDIRQSIIVGSIWLLPNILFIFIDYLLYAGTPLFQALLVIRLFVLATLSVIFVSLRWIKSPATYDYLVLIASCLVLSSVFCINRLHPDLHAYTAGMDYLLLFSIYLLVPNRLLFRIIPSALFTIANLIAHFTLPEPLSGPILTIIAVSLVMSNVLGIWASVRFYSHRRQQYQSQMRSSKLRKDLIQNALVDQLTGVSNRRHFFQAAEAEFERFRCYQHFFSIVMIDLDHFKDINDQFGHPIGDKVLKDFASTITRAKRDIDTFGRLGGEEFALLLPETDLSGATDIAVCLRRACHGIILPEASSRRITISIGVTQVRSDDMNFDAVLSRVDEALYLAKNNGRDRVEVA